MRFALIVTVSPTQDTSQVALQFTQTLLKKHTLHALCFMGKGVLHADESSLAAKEWQHLIMSKNLDTYLCSSATQQYLKETQLANDFVVSGLGEMTLLSLEADKLIAFSEAEGVSQ